VSFNYIPDAPDGAPKGDQRDRAREKAQTQVPKDERRWLMHGGLELSIQATPGLCQTGRKCVLKDGHTVPCWPTDAPPMA